MSSIAVLDLEKDALAELNVLQPGNDIPAAMGVLVLRRLNQIIDNWNAQREAIWTEVFASFTLTAALSPHTIGPTGTFTVTQRPVTIDGCSLVLNTLTPNVYTRIDPIDREQYEALTVPALSTSFPTLFYYEPDWPNGKIFFYPVPDTAYGVRFAYRFIFVPVVVGDTLSVPPGYESALMLTLAESIATPLGRTVPDQTAKLAREARARIFMNNVTVPKLNLQDGQQEDDRSGFDWRSRSFNP